jgi:hypothetical protein
VVPVGIGAAMLQGTGWQAILAEEAPDCPVAHAIRTPVLVRGSGGWQAED